MILGDKKQCEGDKEANKTWEDDAMKNRWQKQGRVYSDL